MEAKEREICKKKQRERREKYFPLYPIYNQVEAQQCKMLQRVEKNWNKEHFLVIRELKFYGEH